MVTVGDTNDFFLGGDMYSCGCSSEVIGYATTPSTRESDFWNLYKILFNTFINLRIE
jgi:hypothetical protein